MKPTSLHHLAIALGALALVTASSALAGDSVKDGPKEIVVPKVEKTAPVEKDWSVEVGSGAQFSNVRESNLDGYTMVPAFVTVAYKIDDVSLDKPLGGLLRGYTEFLFQGSSYAITSGNESRLLGANFGPRYNFVQPGWKVVPYVEGLVGFYFADSQPRTAPVAGGLAQRGLGQDFNFTFGVAGGFRYDIDENWFARLGAVYTHVSNAGLSEPQFENRAIDAFGPEVSIGRRF
ncbi:MAG TPA: acyloxyacyl hydrolase [Candidatus Methylacidiphilales bacterium]